MEPDVYDELVTLMALMEKTLKRAAMSHLRMQERLRKSETALKDLKRMVRGKRSMLVNETEEEDEEKA